MRLHRLAAACCFLLSLVVSATGDDAIEAGRTIVELNCARCHAVGPTGESPFAPAPKMEVGPGDGPSCIQKYSTRVPPGSRKRS